MIYRLVLALSFKVERTAKIDFVIRCLDIVQLVEKMVMECIAP